MRWRRPRFALFAVAALASGLLGTPRAAAQEGEPVETVTRLFWREQENKLQPSGNTKFYVSVEASSGPTRPAGTVKLDIDGGTAIAKPLNAEDPDRSRGRITDDFEPLALGTEPHYIKATFTPDDPDAFAASQTEMGLGIGTLIADPEPSTVGQPVTYRFTLRIFKETPANRRPKGVVSFGDTVSSATAKIAAVPNSETDYAAAWTLTYNSSDRWFVTAVYSPGDGGDDFFLPVLVVIEHGVRAASAPPGGQGTTTTGRRTVTTRRGSPRGALSPIQATTSTTTVAATTTSVTFGAFPTTPPATTDLTAADDDDGPPIAVVVSTLGALGVLGAIAAVRRYRRSAIDWF